MYRLIVEGDGDYKQIVLEPMGVSADPEIHITFSEEETQENGFQECSEMGIVYKEIPIFLYTGRGTRFHHFHNTVISQIESYLAHPIQIFREEGD